LKKRVQKHADDVERCGFRRSQSAIWDKVRQQNLGGGKWRVFTLQYNQAAVLLLHKEKSVFWTRNRERRKEDTYCGMNAVCTKRRWTNRPAGARKRKGDIAESRGRRSRRKKGRP